MTDEMLCEAISRVKRMEALFDLVREAGTDEPLSPAVQEAAQELSAYLSGGQWLDDFALDEQGELPRSLKRGVLAQDGLYELLREIL